MEILFPNNERVRVSKRNKNKIKYIDNLKISKIRKRKMQRR